MRVLIVDDHTLVRAGIGRLLQALPDVDVVAEACNAQQALDLAAIHRPDLILLDLQIPYEDGYTVLRQIRTHTRLSGTIVVAVTANVLPQDVERARRAGFDGFIGKPIELERFPEQIQRVLNGEAVWEPR